MYVKDDYGYKKRVVKRTKRPPLLTVLCIILVVLGFWSIISTYIGIYSGFGTLYPAFNALTVVMGFIGISGVWQMEKWGPVSFAIVIVLKILVDLIWGYLNPWYLLVLIPVAIFLLLIPKMKNTD